MRANVIRKQEKATCNIPCFNEALVRKLRREMPDEEELTDAVSLFAALNDRARLIACKLLTDPHRLVTRKRWISTVASVNAVV